jgi:hypothetical protein
MQGSFKKGIIALVVLGALVLGLYGSWRPGARVASPDAPSPPVGAPTSTVPAPSPSLASAPSASPAPVLLRALGGRAFDAYGVPLGAGIEVRLALREMDPSMTVVGAPAVTDAAGRFEFDATQLEGLRLELPVLLVGTSAERHGRLLLVEELDQASEARLVLLPLVGRLVRLVDQHGEPVRWPAQAVAVSLLGESSQLEFLVPGEGPLRGPADGAIREFLATFRAEPGAWPAPLDWRIEVPGYDYARLRIELLPPGADGALVEQELTLERVTAGFGRIEVRLPPGLVAQDGGPQQGLSLSLGRERGASPFGYPLQPDVAGVAVLDAVPAGTYQAQVGVRGRYYLPSAEQGLAITVQAGETTQLGLEGPAWSACEVEIELADGTLHAGAVRLELRDGWASSGADPGFGRVGEHGAFSAPPYRFGPLPPGGYTVFLRRIPGLLEPAFSMDPFAEGASSPDLMPSQAFTLAPGTQARIRLVLRP